MCYTWKHQSKKEDEIRPEDLITLPRMVRLNITGGEPFLKEDLSEILDVVKRKAKRVVISSNGFLTKRTLDVMSKHRDVGIRISVDGNEETHDHIRGVKGAYQKTLETLQGLRSLGVKDLGIAVTVSDQNAKDLVALHKLAKENCVELATAILHNAYYFHKEDNIIIDKYQVELGLKALIVEFLKSQHPKDWFRAYFTQGIIDHMNGKQRAMKCTMAKDSFYVDPYGNVRPCNVMDFSFGNIKDETFQEIWTSPDAEEARERVGACTYNCWMIGSVGHLMRQNFWVPLFWIIKHKWAWQKTTVFI
jgi:MoaA/NifB/PqqE/SkfB family radical SAM enzyme